MSELPSWALGGHSNAAPRDTFPAYWGALGAGAHSLLISARRSRDGRLLCAPNLSETTGSQSAVADLTAEEVSRLDVGTVFGSHRLDRDHRYAETGTETPWRGHEGGRPDALSHPPLDRVLLHLSRRTRLPLRVEAGDQIDAAVDDVARTLKRFGVVRRVVLAGDRRLLAAAS